MQRSAKAARLFAAFLFALIAGPALSQTTTGDATRGATLWTNDCVSCHGATANFIPAAKNAAKAGGIISFAVGQGMTSAPSPLVPGSDPYADIAEHLNSLVTNPTPSGVAVPFQGSSGAVAANEIYYPTSWGALDSIIAGSPAPTKGTITNINSAAKTITYTAGACQTGADTVRYRGAGNSGSRTTDIRSFTVNIAGPTTGPSLTSSNTANGQTTVPFTYTTTYSPSCPSLTTFGLSGQPAGFGINGSGVISGTPAIGSEGVYPMTVSMTQNGHTTNATVTLTIGTGPPVITSSATANGAVGFSFNYQIVATNGTITGYNASGLPPGLSVNTSTGAITGTPTSNGVFVGSVSATNATTTTFKTVTFTIAVGVPAITSSSTASGQTGQNFTYSIVATNGPITSYAATGLPNGLTLNTSTGVISGIPTAIASTPVTLTATNGTGTSNPFMLTIDVTLGPPIITSALSASGQAGSPFTYQIMASQSPTSFNATGLPAGLSVDTTTGIISGTPTVGGSFPVTISATNATGTGSNTLTLNIALFAPTITSANTASGQTGVPFSYQITAANAPVTYNATGLPAGLTVNTNTGLISGTPTAVGVTNATISATNGAGTGSQGLQITITLGPPVITSANSASGVQGSALTYQITATNSPTTFNATGLPPGVTVNTTNGLISGTPTAMGVFNATVSATNGTGTGSLGVTFNIAIGPPVVTSPAGASAQTGTAFTYQITATNSPTSFNATGLPPGLTVDTTTGLISGVPIPNGTFNAVVSATNGTGTGTRSVTIIVAFGPPGITSPTTATATMGSPFTYQIVAVNSANSYSATGLPPGLTINTTTGLISGTPTLGGTFTVTIGATNPSGITASQVLTITIAFTVPTSTSLAVTTPFNTAVQVNIPSSPGVTSVNIVTQPANGKLTGPAAGTTTFTYTPNTGFSGADAFVYTLTNPAGTSQSAVVTITVGTQPPIAAALTMTVPTNSALTVDLKGFITGSGVTGVAISTQALHGTVAVNGTKVTYTPQHNFFGADSFKYIAFGNAGTSQPATVTVTVIGRTDPTKEADVMGVVSSHASTAQRFARAQIGNFQQHLETLHARAPDREKAAANRAPEAEKAASRVPDTEKAGVRMPDRPVMVASAGASDITGLVPPATTSALTNALVNSAMSLAASQSLSLNATTGNGASYLPDGVQFWLAGNLRFGHRDPLDGSNHIKFTSDGVSAGVDKRFSDRLVLGVGLGFARDKTDIGTDGSKNDTDGKAIAVYGSFRAGNGSFIDGLLGYASLDMDSSRFVPLLTNFARASRRGDQFFGSLSAGYEYRYDSMLVSPYARLDYASTRLKQATESGASGMSLTYFEQTVPMFSGTVGLRVESQHDTRFGSARPRARIEYSHEFEDDRSAVLSYADDFGTRYTTSPTGTKRNALLLGVGSDFMLGSGLKLGVDYFARRASRDDMDQGIRLQFTVPLDGKGSRSWFAESTPFRQPVRFEAGYVYDDNLTRSRDARDKLADSIFSFGASQARIFPIGTNTRVIGSLFASAEELYRYTGLGRVSGGASAELQYRSSAEFDAITLGLQGRVVGDYYDSAIRRGHRFTITASARQSLTDRIEAFAAITGSKRFGKSAVFDIEEYGAKVNLDYALGGPHGSVYLAGEYRRGDVVSSGRFALDSIDVADVFTPDDAYPPGYFAYRFEAKTWLGTIGYNRPLGPRDAIDFSFRRAQSTPVNSPSFTVPGPFRYIDNQYSIIYLMRF